MKRIGLAISTLMMSLSLLFAAPLAFAADSAAKQAACEGVGIASNTGKCTEASGKSLNDIVALAINILSVVVGIVAVIMIIISGLKYVTSNGDSGSISSAKNTLIYAIVGLVIAGMAQIIVKFVLSKL